MSVSTEHQHSLASNLLRLLLAMIPKTAHIPIIRGTLRGRWWIAGSSEAYCWLGGYQLEKQASILSYLQPRSVFYDIGAGVGFYTLLAAHVVGKQGRVYAFETCPQKLAYLKKHVRMNGFSNVTVLDTTLEDDSTIDALVSQSKILPPNVIHINNQGKEAQVLQGAFQTLAAHMPVLFLGIHDDQQRTRSIAFLQGFNYQPTSLDYRPLKTSEELLIRPPISP